MSVIVPGRRAFSSLIIPFMNGYLYRNTYRELARKADTGSRESEHSIDASELLDRRR
jgi:hypothetical protein